MRSERQHRHIRGERPLIAVTGGTGFVGQHVVAALRQVGAEVRLLRSRSGASTSALRASILDKRSLLHAFDGADAVIHLAGSVRHTRRDGFDKQRMLHVLGSSNVVHAAAEQEVGVVVMASAAATVTASETPSAVNDDHVTYPHAIVRRWPFVRTKIEAELAAQDAAAAHGLPLVLLRPTWILGPNAAAERLARRAQSPHIRRFNGGTNIVDVRDVADAAVTTALSDVPDGPYLLAGENVTNQALADRISWITGAAAADVRTRWRDRLSPLDPVEIEMAKYFWYANATRARDVFGFSPRPLDATLSDTFGT